VADSSGAADLSRPHDPGCAQHQPAEPTHRPAGATGWAGAVLLKGEETRAQWAARQLTNLIRIGGKLAVLGVEDGLKSMGWWHVCRPGSWDQPQDLSGQMGQQGDDLSYARALCGRTVVCNGYSADWRPPAGVLCPACAEQI